MPAERALHLRTLWRWQFARWARLAPGRAGLLVLALFPALFFLPLQRFPLFDSWTGGASAVLMLGILAAAFALMRDVGAAHAAEYWMFQKGVDLPSLTLTRWMSDLLFGSVLALWWATGFTIAASNHGVSASAPFIAGLMMWLFGCYAIIGTLLLVLGATGHPRATDSAILILLLTAFSPLLARFISPLAMRAIETARPPFFALTTARQAVSDSTHWPTVVGGLLHTATWILVVVAVATVLIGRRIPSPDHARADG